MEIQPYHKNAKKHPKKQLDQIANSIREFGMNQPIVVDKQGVIIVGHGRYEALKLLNMEPTPDMIRVVDLTEEQAKAYRLADNKLNESDWDMDLVIEELKDLSEPMLELTGFDRDLIIEPDEKDDEVPEVPEEPQSKLGDLYELGNHRVLCGDSTKLEDVERLMDGKKADMVFTDPPYGMNLDTDYSKLKGTSKSPNAKGYKWDKVIGDDQEFDFLTAYAFFEYVDEQFWWGADYYFGQLPPGGSLFVWQKRDKADAEMIGNDFEICWSKQRHKKATFWKRWVGFDSVERGEKRVHPTQKPIELSAWFINDWSEEGSSVVDLFLGSGSTLIASEKTGRICYGCELDNKYIDVILNRWQDYTGKDPILKETSDPNDPRKGLAWSVIKSLNQKENTKADNKNTAAKPVGV